MGCDPQEQHKETCLDRPLSAFFVLRDFSQATSAAFRAAWKPGASHFKQILSELIKAIPFQASNESCSQTPAFRAAIQERNTSPSPPASLPQDRGFYPVPSVRGPQDCAGKTPHSAK